MPNERAEKRLLAAERWFTPEAIEAERQRRLAKVWLRDMTMLLHTLDPAKFVPPGEDMEPGSRMQRIEEGLARVEQGLDELIKLMENR